MATASMLTKGAFMFIHQAEENKDMKIFENKVQENLQSMQRKSNEIVKQHEGKVIKLTEEKKEISNKFLYIVCKLKKEFQSKENNIVRKDSEKGVYNYRL